MSEEPVFYQVRDHRSPNAPPLMLQFVEQTEIDEAESRNVGFTVYDTLLVALVSPSGQVKSNVAREIRRKKYNGEIINHPVYSRQYAEQLKFYDEGDGLSGTGTPLTAVTWLDAGMRQTLKARGIHSIEALKEMPDVSGNDMMGFRKYQQLADVWLKQRAEEAPLVKMNSELEARDSKIDNLERQLADLLARFDEPKRGPGRPPKQAEAA